MATIVQPYNPWREQMAAGIIVPMVTDMIRRNQERADNRLRNEAIQRMISGDGALTEYMTPEMALPEMPAPKLANQAGMMSRLANVLGERRYSGLDTATMTQLAQPYIAEAEAARKRQEAADFAAGLPTGAADMGRYLTQGMMRGVMPESAYNGALGWLQTQTPKFGTINTGDHVIYGQTGPDGRWTEQGRYSMGMSPEAAARTALGWAELNSGNEHWDRNFAAGRDDVEYDRTHPKPHYVQGRDGTLYAVRDATATPVTAEAYAPSREDYRQKIEQFRREHPGWQITEGVEDRETIYAYAYDPQTRRNVMVAEMPKNAPKRSGKPLVTSGTGQGNGNTGITEKDRWNKKVDMLGNEIKGIREKRNAILNAQNLVGGEDYAPEVKQQLEELDRLEAELTRRLDEMIQGDVDNRTSLFEQQTPESMIADMAVASGDVSPESYAAVVPQTVSPAVGATPQAGGRRLSREQYEQLVATAESGADPEYREAGITTRADVENWLRFNGYSWE